VVIFVNNVIAQGTVTANGGSGGTGFASGNSGNNGQVIIHRV
jgi:hypothetical protein